MKFSTAFLAAIAMVGTNAHMVMKTPIPYGKSKLTNGPLDPSGSDFPCKNLFDVESDADINRMAIGEPQTLSFTGSAVHGGGSCQISLTKDLKPTKDSKWMVIKSIEGGCPAGSAGNLGNDAGADVAAKFQYTIPEGIAAGQYTIAWTWVNRIGNREFYMNCGRADITGAKKKRYAPAPVLKRQTSFPDLFVANLDNVSHGCKTAEGINIQFPNPGPVVEKPQALGEYGPPTGCAGGNANTDSGAGSAPAAPVTTSAAAAATTSVAATPSTSGRPANFAEGASSSTTAVATSAPAATTTAAATSAPAATTSAAAAPTSSAPAAPTAPTTPQPGSSTTSQTAGAACSNEGDWACAADGLSFQRCASGTWSVAIPLAGTKCTPGTSSAIQIIGKSKSKAKRGFRA